MGSSRLPRKVIADFGGLPLVVHIATRLKSFPGIDDIVIATSTDGSDDALVEVCGEYGLRCTRGPVDDIVERLLGAARLTGATHVARVWGDCPFVSPELFAAALEAVAAHATGLATAGSADVRSWPVGADIEVWDRTLLEAIASDEQDPRLREFPFEYARSEHNKQGLVIIPYESSLADLHLTVDYPEDLEAARQILAALGARGGTSVPLADVLALLARQPELAAAFSSSPRNIEYKAYLAGREAKGGQA